MMRRHAFFQSPGAWVPVVSLAVVALVASQVPKASELPQVGGEDPVAVLFGDMRTMIGREMIAKADEYFHGGVTGLHHHDEFEHHEHGGDSGEQDEGHEHEHGEGQEGDHLHEHPEDHDDEAGLSYVAIADPWRFITDQVKPPRVERHLQGETTRELLPWLWAAMRIAGDDIQAYQNAAYVLDALYGQPEKSLEVYRLGIRKNPSNPELEFNIGELLYVHFKRIDEAEAHFRAAREKARALDTEEVALVRLRALDFLGALAAKRGDKEELASCLKEAESLQPSHVVTRHLRRLLDEARAR